MKKTGLLCTCLLALAGLFVFSCVREDTTHGYELDEGSLDATGQAFMEAVKTRSGWEQDWRQLTKAGTPLPNEILCCFCPSYGAFYIVPIVSGNKITHIAFYPLDEAEEYAVLKSPLIVDEKEANQSAMAWSFLKSELSDQWTGKGLSMNITSSGTPVKKKSKEDVLTRSWCPYPNFMFAAECWVNYQYISGYQNTALDEINNRYHAALDLLTYQLAPHIMRGRDYNGHDALVFYPLNNFYNDEYHAMQIFERAGFELYALSFVRHVKFVWLWSKPIPPPGSGGGNPPGGGGSQDTTKVKPFPNAKYAMNDIPDNITPQKKNHCAVRIFSFLDNLFGGTNDQRDMYMLYIAHAYDILEGPKIPLIEREGCYIPYLRVFAEDYFSTSPFDGYKNAIDNRHIVITDMNGGGGLTHTVAVIAYEGDDLIIMEPGDGTQKKISQSEILGSYNVSVSGKK